MGSPRKSDLLTVPEEKTLDNKFAKRDSKLYAVFPIQHGAEARNRYKDLIANIKTTQLVNVFAKNPSQTKRGSIMTSTGILAESKSQIPPLFVLAAGEVLADLKIHSISMRTTAAAIDYLPHAPKPPSIKYKTGKGGISDAVIPVDESTTTMRDVNGKVIALAQNQKYKPSSDDIGPMQYKIPLEKIILGLNKNPPEFKMINVSQNGVLEFNVISDDPAISMPTYKIDLNANNIAEPLSSALNRESPASAMQPDFWNPAWGDFKEKLQQGFPLEYQKDSAQAFKSYEVYGRGESPETRLMITGDQDVHSMPRSSLYKLGDLDTIPLDSHEMKEGIDLEQKISKVHQMITIQKLNQKENEFKQHMANLMNQAPLGFDEKNPAVEHEYFRQRLNSERLEYINEISNLTNKQSTIIENFISESSKYIIDLGDVTPFEAYAWIRINLREQELMKEYINQPQKLQAQIDQVRVTASTGLDHALHYKLDIDLNPVWFNHDPENCIKHVEKQLNNNQFVSGEVLQRYMEEKELNPETECSIFEKNQPAGAVVLSTRDPKYSNLTLEVARKTIEWVKNDPSTEVYMVDIYGKSRRVSYDSEIDGRKLKDLFIINIDNNQRSVIHLNENRISSNISGVKGQEQVELILAKASIDFNALKAIGTMLDKDKFVKEEQHKEVLNTSLRI